MSNIERVSRIDALKLNQGYYFHSLLGAAYEKGMISESEIEKIQLDCIDLLSYKAKRYTDNNSSSLRVELAEYIMTSNLYTIGLYLKTFPVADDAVNALTEKSMLDLYLSGRKIIDSMINSAKRRYSLVIKSILDNNNQFYKPTVVSAIRGFFKKYNPDYGAHENIITADYPTCNPIEDITGIEFIKKYLDFIYAENMFCKHFFPQDIDALLCGVDNRYEALVFNIFEEVLTGAIGCVLSGQNPCTLNISAAQAAALCEQIYLKNDLQIEKDINRACEKLIPTLQITSRTLQSYIKASLPKIISHVCFMKKNKLLDRVFITPENTLKNPKFL
ncbi:MAG: DUF6179 domain-containing protein [Eubacteriales bacterium]|nr:DUF6179 domain-containing protein [Eubacteriales bacterium]MDD4422481.1 DUF6179 domain-containing protein [Eubacteriales bacterium]